MYQKNKPVRENALTRDLLGKGLWVLKFLREMITQQQWLPKEKVGGWGAGTSAHFCYVWVASQKHNPIIFFYLVHYPDAVYVKWKLIPQNQQRFIHFLRF